MVTPPTSIHAALKRNKFPERVRYCQKFRNGIPWLFRTAYHVTSPLLSCCPFLIDNVSVDLHVILLFINMGPTE